jgi:hypothetical protein
MIRLLFPPLHLQGRGIAGGGGGVLHPWNKAPPPAPLLPLPSKSRGG